MINTGKIFLAWLTTVFIGSLGLVLGFFIVQFFENKGMSSPDFIVSEILWGVLLSMLISALISLPTMITLTISNIRFNNQNLSFKLQFRKLNKIHIFMAVLTFAVIEGIIIYNAIDSYNYQKSYSNNSRLDFDDFIPFLLFLAVITWYVICAILIWFLFFKKEIREMREKKVQSISSEE